MQKYLDENDFIISKTDLKGRISYGNEKFISISGYTEDELLGAPHNILRHPEMPRVVYAHLWESIQKKKEVFVFVKNRCKNNDFYWVFANVTASIDALGKAIGYYSVRRKPSERGIKEIESLYAQLLNIEKREGLASAKKYLGELLEKQGVDFNEFIINLQK